MFSPKGSTCLGHVGRLDDESESQADPQVGEVAERLSHTRQILRLFECGPDAGCQRTEEMPVNNTDRTLHFVSVVVIDAQHFAISV